MPYQSTTAPPPEEATGQTALPLTRIKKIIRLDEDISQCSNNAAFLVSVATELFIRYLTEQAHTVVKSEKKPRKTIQYRDLATAVSRIDNLEFLSDVIPKTTTYKQFKEKRARDAAREARRPKGQGTLNRKTFGPNGGLEPPPRREESILNLDANGSHSTARPPMVIHSARVQNLLNDNMEGDVPMRD